jgi:hypothetical protein
VSQKKKFLAILFKNFFKHHKIPYEFLINYTRVMSDNLTKNTNSNIDTIPKKTLGWFFGSFMLLFSLILLSESILASTLGFSGALISIPPTGKLINQFLKSKYNFIIEGELKVALCFVLFIFLMSAIPETTKQNLPNTVQQQSQVSSEGAKNVVISKNEQPKSNKSDIVVKSIIVKKVNGKFRYFFDIRNNGTEEFSGEVSIFLHNNKQSSKLGGDTFATTHPINPMLGFGHTYIEINTGTPLIHGEYGITKFKYEVKVADKTIKLGENIITDRYEDASF